MTRNLYADTVLGLKEGEDILDTSLMDATSMPDGFAVLVKSKSLEVRGGELIAGCQRIPLVDILNTPSGALERVDEGPGRVVATATMVRRVGLRGWWLGGRAYEHGEVKQYATSMTVAVKPVEPDSPEDVVIAKMQPGLYACGVAAHQHLFFLSNTGRWSRLGLDRLHGGPGIPSADCVITQGASTEWLTTMGHDSTIKVDAEVLRKHAVRDSAGSPVVSIERVVRRAR